MASGMKKLTLLALPVFAACTGGSTQILSGRVAPGFPTPITQVRVVAGTRVVASAPVAADGSFRLSVPAGSGYAIRLVGSGQSALVFPRHSGAIDTTFAIRAAGVSFDLGGLHYVGSAGTTHFAFHDQGGTGSGSGGSCDGNDHDSSGATCVDDGDTSGGTCGSGGEQEGDGSDSGAGSDDGSDSGGGSDSSGSDDGDAVAEHNFPQDGCADGNDNGGDDGSGDGSDDSGSGDGSDD